MNDEFNFNNDMFIIMNRFGVINTLHINQHRIQ